MPISEQEMKDYEMSNILSSTKEDLEKLTDIELTTISDILSQRKNNRYIQPRTQSLLELVHYLIMQDSDRERKQTELKEKHKENYTAGRKITMKEWDEELKNRNKN